MAAFAKELNSAQRWQKVGAENAFGLVAAACEDRGFDPISAGRLAHDKSARDEVRGWGEDFTKAKTSYEGYLPPPRRAVLQEYFDRIELGLNLMHKTYSDLSPAALRSLERDARTADTRDEFLIRRSKAAIRSASPEALDANVLDYEHEDAPTRVARRKAEATMWETIAEGDEDEEDQRQRALSDEDLEQALVRCAHGIDEESPSIAKEDESDDQDAAVKVEAMEKLFYEPAAEQVA